MGAKGINLTYTEDLGMLNPETLAQYDGLLVYANIARISPEQEKAVLDFVEGECEGVPCCGAVRAALYAHVD